MKKITIYSLLLVIGILITGCCKKTKLISVSEKIIDKGSVLPIENVTVHLRDGLITTNDSFY